MMAGFHCSGALLLVLFAASSYSFPSKTGFGPSPSFGGGHVASAPAANWEVPSSGGYAPSAPSAGVQAQAAPQYLLAQPVGSPAASQPTSSGAPGLPIYGGSSSEASFQPAAAHEVDWIVEPPSFLASHTTAGDAYPSGSYGGGLGLVDGGDLSTYEGSIEHGNSESETESHGYPPAPVEVSTEESVEELPSSLGASWSVLPFPYDYMLLAGLYPTGTFTQFSQSYEQGADHWQDSHYLRYNVPAYTYEPVQMAPVVRDPVKAPQMVKQPSQPVKQRIGF